MYVEKEALIPHLKPQPGANEMAKTVTTVGAGRLRMGCCGKKLNSAARDRSPTGRANIAIMAAIGRDRR